MYKLLIFTFFLLFTGSFSAQKKNLKAYLDLKEFYHPSIGSYIEIQLQFSGISTHLKNIGDSALQSTLVIYMDIFDTDSLVASDSYILNSPQFLLRDSIVEDFFEIKRFALNEGNYTLNLELLDLGDSTKNKISGSEKFTIESRKNVSSFSDITIAEYAVPSSAASIFQKSGYQIIPMLSKFFPTELSKMPIYFESYNTHKLSGYKVRIKREIINASNNKALDDFTKIITYDTAQIQPHLGVVDIELLETGSYILKLSMVDETLNEICSTSISFERSNEITTSLVSTEIVLDPAFQTSIPSDSVGFYLESLIPIARPAEVKNIINTLKTKDGEKCRKHLQAFWVKTAKVDSYSAWIKYKAQVDFVETVYGNNFQDGYETDRGRVYLQYGAPNTLINKETSPSEYPYEIWTYNKIGVFNNRRFVFYNPNLVNRAYRLLHSDMVGELKNPRWPQMLSKRNTVNGNIDDPNSNNVDHWGGNSNDYYRQY